MDAELRGGSREKETEGRTDRRKDTQGRTKGVVAGGVASSFVVLIRLMTCVLVATPCGLD